MASAVRSALTPTHSAKTASCPFKPASFSSLKITFRRGGKPLIAYEPYGGRSRRRSSAPRAGGKRRSVRPGECALGRSQPPCQHVGGPPQRGRLGVAAQLRRIAGSAEVDDVAGLEHEALAVDRIAARHRPEFGQEAVGTGRSRNPVRNGPLRSAPTCSIRPLWVNQAGSSPTSADSVRPRSAALPSTARIGSAVRRASAARPARASPPGNAGAEELPPLASKPTPAKAVAARLADAAMT